jgi:hypothetical protein
LFQYDPYADDTAIIGLCENSQDELEYMAEVNRILMQCKELNLIINASKTKEMVFTTQRSPLPPQSLTINGVAIEICKTIKYLGLFIDADLRFNSHVKHIVTKARQRFYIIASFYKLGMTSVNLKLLFRSFVMSIVMYCAPVYFHHLTASAKSDINKLFKLASKLGIDIELLPESEKHFSTYVLRSFFNPGHFIYELDRMPSGRFRALKWRTTVGKNSFFRHAILFLNNLLF